MDTTVPESAAEAHSSATLALEKPHRDPGTPVKWYRCKIPREQMSLLNRKSNLKAAGQTLGFLAILCATGTLFVWTCFHAPWFAPLALLLHGACCAFQINAVHELVHESVFKSSWPNRFFAGLFSFTGWYNHYAFWASHAEHHKFTLHPPDDQEVVLPQHATVKAYLKLAVVDYMGVIYSIRDTWRTARGRVVGPWETHLYSNICPDQLKPVRRWAQFQIIGHLAVGVAAITTGYWPVWIAISFGRFFGNGVFWLCNSAQHIGLVDNYPDFRVACRTIYLNPALQFLYWHMNYHTEHHMYAGVPCYNLGRLHRLIRHELPEPPRGLYRTWTHIAQILERQKREPTYQYFPALPPPAAVAIPSTA